MSQDFNNVLPDATAVLKEDYNIVPGHQVKWGVLEILPLKTEIEGLNMQDMAADDIRKAVPWDAGIIMRVVGLKTRDPQNIVRDLFGQDPNGRVSLNFASKYMSQWVKLDRSEVERGWARQYNRDKRKLVYDFPPNWNILTNMQKFAYWMTMMGGRYGFPAGALTGGSTFYAYFTRQKSKQDKWFSDVKKVYQQDGVWFDECPTEMGSTPVTTLRQIFSLVDEEFAKTKAAYENGETTGSTPYTNPGSAYRPDPNAGF
jgi:hypothetical protein